MYNPYSLKGKTILVTGASSGIGSATAIECSKLGASVILTGRDESRLYDTFQNLSGVDEIIQHARIAADLTDEESINSLVEKLPLLDGVVSNAGININKSISFVKKDDLEKTFLSNTFASIMLIKCLLKMKKINKGASIVFTSSISSFCVTPSLAIYASSKAALTSYMRSCALELAHKQIRANAVHPGMVVTKLIKDSVYSQEDLLMDMNQYPLKRYGRPEEIAWAIIYLLSDASQWVTGTSLIIDGGKLLK
jgi:NAD(P)-dependent dehydrogenase (short-subunit alcohol dehydrogenase family)